MSPFRGLTRAWRFAVRKTLGLWVKTTIKPDEIAASIAARGRPVCYVLENESRTDFAVLDNACAALGIPAPEQCFALVRQGAFLGARRRRHAPRRLVQLAELASRERILRRRPHSGGDLLGKGARKGAEPVAAGVHRGLGAARTLPQALERALQRPQQRGVFRRADRAARGAGGPAAAARCAPCDARFARRVPRAARIDHRTGSVAPPYHGRAHHAHASRAPRRARRDERPARAGARAARARARAPAQARAAARGTAHRAQGRDGDRRQLLANLHHHHGLRSVASVDAPLRRRGIPSTWRICTTSAMAPRSSTCRATAATWTTCCSRM